MATTKNETTGEQTVLALGEQAAQAVAERSDDALGLLERYVETFERWEATWQSKDKGANPFSDEEKEMAERIAAQHAQIIRLAAEMYSEVDSSLRSLHIKGKGFKTYIDQLPQRISTIKPKKG
jgi:predicted lipoprotein